MIGSDCIRSLDGEEIYVYVVRQGKEAGREAIACYSADGCMLVGKGEAGDGFRVFDERLVWDPCGYWARDLGCCGMLCLRLSLMMIMITMAVVGSLEDGGDPDQRSINQSINQSTDTLCTYVCMYLLVYLLIQRYKYSIPYLTYLTLSHPIHGGTGPENRVPTYL